MKHKFCLCLIASCIVVFLTNVFILDDVHDLFGGDSKLKERVLCQEKMVYQVNSMGQLGNQMMDYGTVYVAAKELPGYVGMLDKSRQYLIRYFQHIELQDITPRCRRIKERQNAMNMNTGAELMELIYSEADDQTMRNFTSAHPNIAFHPYDWMPILYPKYIGDLKRQFTWQDSIMKETLQTFDLVKALYLGAEKPLLFIGVHIRRGDYEHHLQLYYKMKLLGPEFYLAGIKYFEQKYSLKFQVIFLAVSDDIRWVRENILYPDLYVVSKSAEVDMALLGLCNHTITDYGTFGLWPSLIHGGEHYTTNVYEDFIVYMMYQIKGWTVINMTTPLVSGIHPKRWLDRKVTPQPTS